MGKLAIFLIAMKLAEQHGGSSRDAIRVALPAMLINPPMLGLILATTLANRLVPAVKANKGTAILSVAGVPPPP